MVDYLFVIEKGLNLKVVFFFFLPSQFKFKLYNTTTTMCRRTLLAPTYGTPLQRLVFFFVTFSTASHVETCVGGHTPSPYILF